MNIFTLVKDWYREHKDTIKSWGKKGAFIAGALGTVWTLLLNLKDKESFEKWILNASDEDLDRAYEKERLERVSRGEEQTSHRMRRISNEMNERAAIKAQNDPKRNKNPNFRWTDEARWDKD